MKKYIFYLLSCIAVVLCLPSVTQAKSFENTKTKVKYKVVLVSSAHPVNLLTSEYRCSLPTSQNVIFVTSNSDNFQYALLVPVYTFPGCVEKIAYQPYKAKCYLHTKSKAYNQNSIAIRLTC